MLERNMELPVSLPDDDGEGKECAELLLAMLDQHPGVQSAQIDFERNMLKLHYNPERINVRVVDGIASDLGVRLGSRMHHCTMELGGVGCRDCAARLEQELEAIPGVHKVSANAAARVVGVHYEEIGDLAAVEKRITEMGYQVGALGEAKPPFWERNIGLIWAGATLFFLLIGLAFQNWMPIAAVPQLYVLFYVLSYVAGGHEAAREAWRDLRQGRLNVDLLMLLSAFGAALLGHWAEGAMLLFLFSLSGALEEFAMDRTRNAIEALTALRPSEATVLRGDVEVRLPVEAVAPGDIVLVRPGEQVSVDGVVLLGATSINQAAITGESMPVAKSPGDDVF
ncbi:MAG: heavy metal translocating P-type ATPase, partial [Caldilineales bacterium]|nr:heavy metal translocating P-type ATPase [Caldilineales bacterium]